MTPEARLEAACGILSGLEATRQPADRFLADWFRARRFAGSKDRTAITERVYSILRHRAEFAWRMGTASPRALVIASLLAEGENADTVTALFARGGYGPAPLSAEEIQYMASPPEGAPPHHVKGGYPQWLEPELKRAFQDRLILEMEAMLARAPVDLRVNTLRAERDDMLIGLKGLGFDAAATPYSPHGIRVPSAAGLNRLSHTSYFQTGAIEFQDEASQLAALLSAAKPGMRVLDLAAGAGGKSLALAASMRNQGEIIAADSDPRRLARLRPRARRAGVKIIRTCDLGEGRPQGEFDLVVVDAPCSGSGTWRRNPEFKWRLTAAELAEKVELQARLIEEGARFVRRGGNLVYAVCSILPCESGDRIGAFLDSAREFSIAGAASRWHAATGSSPPPGMDRTMRVTPALTGTDGFFVCVLAQE